MSENSNKQSGWSKYSLKRAVGLTLHFFGWRLALGLIGAIASLALFGWLAEDIFEGATISFDETVRSAVHTAATPMITGLMKFVTHLGSTIFLFVLFLFATAALYRLKHKRALILFVITMLGEVILLTTLKASFQRARPEPFFDYTLPSSFSFPSGHSLSSFCFYGILAWLVTARMENRGLKILVWTLAAVLVLLIGLSRVYLGVHYPSDVLAGYATGLVWVVTIALGDFFLKRRTMNQSKDLPVIEAKQNQA